MKRFAQLTFIACLALASLAASFPYVTLNNKTNRLSDNGSALTFNGSALGSGSISTNAPNIAAGSPAVFVSSNVLGAATSAQLQTTLGNVYQATNAALTAVAAAGDVVLAKVTATKAFQSYQGALTHAGTVTLDFDGAQTVNSMSVTGALTLATSNLATNRTYLLRLTGTSTNSALTAPAWKWQGYVPTQITASKVSEIQLLSWGSTDASVDAWFTEQP